MKITSPALLPGFIRRIAWNIKYVLFDYGFTSAPRSTIDYLCSNLPEDASILELGCGGGALLRGLRESGCKCHYCGVDISKRALALAQSYGDQRTALIQSDIESFCSPFRWNAILLIESIYYLDIHRMPELFSRLETMLDDCGFILVRVHDVERHHAHMEALRRIAPNGEMVDPTLFRVVKSATEP